MADNKQLEVGKFVTIAVGNFKGISAFIKGYRKEDDSFEVVAVMEADRLPNVRWQRGELRLSEA